MDSAPMEIEGVNLSTFEFDIALHPSTSEPASSIVSSSTSFRFIDEGCNHNPPNKRGLDNDASEESNDRITETSHKTRAVAGPSRRAFDDVCLHLFFHAWSFPTDYLIQLETKRRGLQNDVDYMEDRYGKLADEFNKLQELHEQYVNTHSILEAERTSLAEKKSELVWFSFSLYIIAQIVIRSARMSCMWRRKQRSFRRSCHW